MTICRTLFLCLLAGLPLGVTAREGLVETRDGKIFAGDIRLSDGQYVVANAVRGFVERVNASNVMAATFTPDAAAPSAGGSLDWIALPEPWQTEVVGARDVGGAVFLNGMFRLQTAGAAEAPDTDAVRLSINDCPATGRSWRGC